MITEILAQIKAHNFTAGIETAPIVRYESGIQICKCLRDINGRLPPARSRLEAANLILRCGS